MEGSEGMVGCRGIASAGIDGISAENAKTEPDMNKLELNAWTESAGLAPRDFSCTEIVSGKRVHATQLGVREGATTVLALVAESVNDIWEKGTGRRQQIRIDTRHAEVAMASAWLVKVDGELATSKFPSPMTPIEGTFTCADGATLFNLCTFPSLVDGTVEALGCELTAESIRAAVAARTSSEIETLINGRDLTGVIVRDHEGWLRHPQGQALADQPTVHIEQIGDAPPAPIPPGERPLSGIRVLDATRVIAGPTGSRTLAEFGADVLNVGHPDLVDFPGGQIDTAHGKRRAFLDLNAPDGTAHMLDLAGSADVFVQSYRPDSYAKRGLGARDVAARRPGIVYVTETAYGNVGPWRSKRGFDGSVQAATGIMSLRRTPLLPAAGEPAPLVMALNDYGTGYWEAYGILEALKLRATVGGSWHVRVSLAQTARWFMRMGAVHDPNEAISPAAAQQLVDQFSETVPSGYGALTRLRPII